MRQSVWIDLFCCPALAQPAPAARAVGLATALLAEGLVVPPWTVLVGEIEPSSPLGMSSIARGENTIEGIAVVDQGHEVDGLRALLAGMPASEAWLVHFPQLGPGVAEALDVMGARNGDVVLLHLPAPHPVLITNAYEFEFREVPMQDYLAVTAAAGPRSLAETALHPLLTAAFGDEYQTWFGVT